MASSNSSAIRRTGPMMVIEQMRRAVVIAVVATLAGIAHADTLPIVGVLAPGENGPVLHGLPGWRSNGEPMRYLDEHGRAQCCVHIAPMPLVGASTLMRDGQAGGDLYVVEFSDALVTRENRKPLLGPVLNAGVTTERRSSAGATLRQGDHRSRLSRCTTSEGVRFTLKDEGTSVVNQLYLPLGYDVTPSCR